MIIFEIFFNVAFIRFNKKKIPFVRAYKAWVDFF